MSNEVSQKKGVKAITYKLKLNSEQLFQFLEKEGGKSVGALERVGSLFRMLTKEEGLTESVQKWINEIFTEAEEELGALLAQKEEVANLCDMSAFEVSTPDLEFDVVITHPSIWKLINLIKQIDNELSEMENMYLAGFVENAELDQAKMQSLAIVRRVIHKIFKGTAPGKREGGPFSPIKFVLILKQVRNMDNIDEMMEKALEIDKNYQKKQAAEKNKEVA